MKFLKMLALAALVVLPSVASAQVLQGTGDLFEEALDIVRNVLIPLAFVLALLFFFWGVAMYIRSEGQGKEDGKRIMIWGVVALFVMSSIWGLVYFLRDEIGLVDDATIPIPTIGPAGRAPGDDLNI